MRCADGRHLAATAVVLEAGAWTAPLAAQLGVHLPVVAKKRDVFVLDSPAMLPQCPLVVDPGGVWFRPEGRGFIAGAPPRDDTVDEAPLEAIDHAWFDERIWPLLAARVPAFEALRVRSAWAGYYEMNTFDHNGLAGALPGWRNVYTACGFFPVMACSRHRQWAAPWRRWWLADAAMRRDWTPCRCSGWPTGRRWWSMWSSERGRCVRLNAHACRPSFPACKTR